MCYLGGTKVVAIGDLHYKSHVYLESRLALKKVDFTWKFEVHLQVPNALAIGHLQWMSHVILKDLLLWP